MYKNLSHYIEVLEQAGELVRIRVPVDTDLEIAELTDRQCKQPGGGKALLFENCGFDFPVLTNMLGSERRMALALGVECLDDLTRRIEDLFAELTTPKHSFYDKLRLLPTLSSVAQWMPRISKRKGACQAVVLGADSGMLNRLPVLKCAPCDGGRFLTLPMVNTIDPETGIRNVGMYRMQVFSNTVTGMHWHCHKTGARHYEGYRKRNERMPVTVTLGGDPAYTYAATAPLPDQVDEYLLAGFIRRHPVTLVKCLTNDLYVPSDCDFVIEGYVDPSEKQVQEGPFGDHTGFYSLEDFYPVFHITCITHRKGAVYPATIVGIPPQEDAYIAKATERIFLAPIRMIVQPEIENIYLPDSGVAHNLALVDIQKRYAGQAFKVAASMWGAGQMMLNKCMLVTSGLGPRLNNPEMLKHALNRLSISQGLLFSKGPLDVLDHAAPQMGMGGKLAIDLTEPNGSESPGAVYTGAFDPAGLVKTEGIDGIGARWMREGWPILVLRTSSREKLSLLAERFLQANDALPIKCLIFFDSSVDLEDASMLIWLAGNHVDPVRDTYIYEERIWIVDARIKYGFPGFSRQWPNPVVMDEGTVKRVDSRWMEYGLGSFISSPSEKYHFLLRGHEAAIKE